MAGLLPNEINQSILFININNKTYNTLLDLINEEPCERISNK